MGCPQPELGPGQSSALPLSSRTHRPPVVMDREVGDGNQGWEQWKPGQLWSLRRGRDLPGHTPQEGETPFVSAGWAWEEGLAPDPSPFRSLTPAIPPFLNPEHPPLTAYRAATFSSFEVAGVGEGGDQPQTLCLS